MINWIQCKQCSRQQLESDIKLHLKTCRYCDYHFPYTSKEFISLIFEHSQYKQLFTDIKPVDLLSFIAKQPYAEKLTYLQNKTGLNESVICAKGDINGHSMITLVTEFNFMAGTIGTATSKIIQNAFLYALEHQLPVIAIINSGGIRMQESVPALMQMPMMVHAVNQYKRGTKPYIVFFTNPCSGGTTASFASMGDLSYAEPEAQICFTGQRVIEQTIMQKKNGQSQKAETLLQRGFIDDIVHRKEIRKQIMRILNLFNMESLCQQK